jgi:RimJ/RimL family protein N-acetyltransferase
MDQYNDLPAVGSSQCNDDFIRSVGLLAVKPLNPLQMSDVEIELLWQYVRTQDYMFSDFERDNREGFVARLRDMRHLHLDIGGDGYCILLNAWCCDTPELHFCIWNPQRTIQQTVEAGQQILNFVFQKMKATRVSGFIPENNKQAIKFATLLGFKFEGCIRQAHLFFGNHYNVHAYGLLRNEWEQRQRRLNNGCN